MAFVLEHHVGPWINCMNLVPRVVPEIVQQPNPAPRAVPYPNYSSPNPNTHPFMPYLNPSQVDIHSQIHDNNSVIPYSNPNKAFLLHIPPNGPTNQVARAPFEARFTVSRRKSLWAMPAALAPLSQVELDISLSMSLASHPALLLAMTVTPHFLISIKSLGWRSRNCHRVPHEYIKLELSL